jgi:hypothetical protein
MTRVAGAILAGFSLLGIIGIRLGHNWIAAHEIAQGGYIRPSVLDVFPVYDLLLPYAGMGLGLYLILRTGQRKDR